MVKIVRQNYRCNRVIFNRVKKELESFIKVDCIISHVGSTIIPNISGKNIIDILIGVMNTNDLTIVTNTLIKNGYYLGKETNKNYQFLASRKEETREGDIHLHVTIINSAKYNNFLLLKNYLLNNPNIAKDYSNHKKILANKYQLNRKEYRKIKSDYVSKMITDARKYYLTNFPKSLIFIRHAENIVDDKLSNNRLPLSKKGIIEATSARDKLSNSFDLIISSPAKRACQTAEIIGNNMNYVTDKRLLEKGYGNKLQDGKESDIDAVIRIHSFLDDLKKYPNKRILIVTHGSLLNLIRNVMEEKNIKRNHIGNCYISKYENIKE